MKTSPTTLGTQCQVSWRQALTALLSASVRIDDETYTVTQLASLVATTALVFAAVVTAEGSFLISMLCTLVAFRAAKPIMYHSHKKGGTHEQR